MVEWSPDKALVIGSNPISATKEKLMVGWPNGKAPDRFAGIQEFDSLTHHIKS